MFWILFIGSVGGSCLLTYLAILACRRFGVLDIPNERSSHSSVTPRGGGVGIFLPVLAVTAWLLQSGRIEEGLGMSLLWGGLLVAGVGAVDDFKPLPVMVRLPAHLLASIAAAWLILARGGAMRSVIVTIVAAIFIAGMLNIYNFMDGIDGLAGSESSMGGLAMLAFAGSFGIAGLSELGTVVLGTSLGFLAWNWPRARVFMGDGASGFLGFLFGCVTVACAARDARSLWPWLIVLGVFLVDSGITLMVRLSRGERIYQAHRKHAYQNLARLYRSHSKVTIGVIVINLLWLGPIAWLALRSPHLALWVAVAALVPLCVVAVVAGAGRDRFV